MKILRNRITNYISANFDENETAWDSGATYKYADEVRYKHYIYKYAGSDDTNTDDDPETDYAKKLADELGELNNSITGGQGNLAGFVGEVVVAEIIEAEHNNTYDSDLTWFDNITIDVKTKRTTVAPKDYYECSIAAYNTKQKCDLYAFCRVNANLDTLWFLG